MRAALLTTLAFVAASVAGCGDSNPAGPSPSTPTTPAYASLPDYPPGTSTGMMSMLTSLIPELNYSLTSMQDALPANPHIANWMQDKIAWLKNPSVTAEIVQGARWHERSVSSRNGMSLPVMTVFATENLRGEALVALNFLPPVVQALEGFFETAFPATSVRMWYGFRIGNSSGGGVLHMEDRLTYVARRSLDSNVLPYDAILAHEVSHTFMGNEILNQFLELYTYNLISTGSTDIATWVETRGWISNHDDGGQLGAVLDIYELVGVDVMKRAYQATRPLRPPFGERLSQAAFDAFMSQVPEQFKTQVRLKLARLM